MWRFKGVIEHAYKKGKVESKTEIKRLKSQLSKADAVIEAANKHLKRTKHDCYVCCCGREELEETLADYEKESGTSTQGSECAPATPQTKKYCDNPDCVDGWISAGAIEAWGWALSREVLCQECVSIRDSRPKLLPQKELDLLTQGTGKADD